MMSKSLISQYIPSKRTFDPSNELDRKLAFNFLKKNSWMGITETNTCPFFCDWPYLDVPSMLKDRLLEYYGAQQ